MKNFVLLGTLSLIIANAADALKPSATERITLQSRFFSSNTDMFGGSSPSPEPIKKLSVQTTDTLRDQAAKLRQEAAELEVALREEARGKGVPEEVINKLIPIRAPASPKPASSQAEGGVLVMEEKVVQKFTSQQVRSKLGYLSAGDPVRMTSELDRVKSSGMLKIWNSYELQVKPNFDVNNAQLTSKTSIQPPKLRLDDVGFDYQKVLIAAVAVATVFGVSANFIGGQLGFIVGYLSALIPVTLVGVGSIAPALIGDVLNKIKFATNEKEREKYIKANAGKFLAGYVVGLPVSRFSPGGASNTVEFFQLRPSGDEAVDKKMYSSRKFKQTDIARYSIVCLAGPVAECIEFGESSGTMPNDVNVLYELMNAVEPALTPESAQSHIRWSAVQAHSIVTKNKVAYQRLCDAFAKGADFEACIAILEAEVNDGSLPVKPSAEGQ